jgi:hypothetical protein
MFQKLLNNIVAEKENKGVTLDELENIMEHSTLDVINTNLNTLVGIALATQNIRTPSNLDFFRVQPKQPTNYRYQFNIIKQYVLDFLPTIKNEATRKKVQIYLDRIPEPPEEINEFTSIAYRKVLEDKGFL